MKKTKPAMVGGGSNELSITEWEPRKKGTSVGFFSVILPCGLIIRSLVLHERNGDQWITMPGRVRREPDGSEGWEPYVDFAGDTAKKMFKTAVLEALEAHFAEEAQATSSRVLSQE